MVSQAQRVAAIGLVLALSLVIASGLRLSARVWTSLTVLKLLPLALLLGAFAAAGRPLPPAPTATPSTAWLAAGLAVMFSLQGFEIVPVIAGQARSPCARRPVRDDRLAPARDRPLLRARTRLRDARCRRSRPLRPRSRTPLPSSAALSSPGSSRPARASRRSVSPSG